MREGMGSSDPVLQETRKPTQERAGRWQPWMDRGAMHPRPGIRAVRRQSDRLMPSQLRTLAMYRPDMTEAEWEQFRRLLHTHPQQYLRIAEDDIRRYPDDPEAYVDCHWAWIRLGRNEYALADIDTAMSLRNSPATRLLRAILLRRMGRYQ